MFIHHGRPDRIRLFGILFGMTVCLLNTSASTAEDATQSPKFSIPYIDLSDQLDRQVIIDREQDQYLGHPTTVLLEDNKTMLCVYPKGHGKGGIVYKRSNDAGLTWSDRLPTDRLGVN